MNFMRSVLLSIAACTALISTPSILDAQRLQIDSIAAQLQSALATAEFTAFTKWFADSVRFDGEVQVLMDRVGGRLVLHDSTVMERSAEALHPGWIAAVVRKESLVKSYDRMVEKAGRERFTGLLRDRRWQVLRADRDGFPYRHGRAGDYVLYTHLRTDEPPDVLDEVVIFVIRETTNGLRVVAHLADY
jgi:hypothetical protein